MKKVLRTISINVETDRSIVVNRREGTWGWCPLCNVQLISMAEAVEVTGLSESALYKRLDAIGFHFDKHMEGHVFICIGSLLHHEQSSE